MPAASRAFGWAIPRHFSRCRTCCLRKCFQRDAKASKTQTTAMEFFGVKTGAPIQSRARQVACSQLPRITLKSPFAAGLCREAEGDAYDSNLARWRQYADRKQRRSTSPLGPPQRPQPAAGLVDAEIYRLLVAGSKEVAGVALSSFSGVGRKWRRSQEYRCSVGAFRLSVAKQRRACRVQRHGGRGILGALERARRRCLRSSRAVRGQVQATRPPDFARSSGREVASGLSSYPRQGPAKRSEDVAGMACLMGLRVRRGRRRSFQAIGDIAYSATSKEVACVTLQAFLKGCAVIFAGVLRPSANRSNGSGC